MEETGAELRGLSANSEGSKELMTELVQQFEENKDQRESAEYELALSRAALQSMKSVKQLADAIADVQSVNRPLKREEILGLINSANGIKEDLVQATTAGKGSHSKVTVNGQMHVVSSKMRTTHLQQLIETLTEVFDLERKKEDLSKADTECGVAMQRMELLRATETELRKSIGDLEETQIQKSIEAAEAKLRELAETKARFKEQIRQSVDALFSRDFHALVEICAMEPASKMLQMFDKKFDDLYAAMEAGKKETWRRTMHKKYSNSVIDAAVNAQEQFKTLGRLYNDKRKEEMNANLEKLKQENYGLPFEVPVIVEFDEWVTTELRADSADNQEPVYLWMPETSVTLKFLLNRKEACDLLSHKSQVFAAFKSISAETLRRCPCIQSHFKWLGSDPDSFDDDIFKLLALSFSGRVLPPITVLRFLGVSGTDAIRRFESFVVKMAAKTSDVSLTQLKQEWVSLEEDTYETVDVSDDAVDALQQILELIENAENDAK